MTTYLTGLLATNDMVTGQIPESWRAMMLRLAPNGDLPFTALTSKIKEKIITSIIHNWWTEIMSGQRALLNNTTAVYTDAALTTPYTSGGVIGDFVYLKLLTAGERLQFRPRHTVKIVVFDQATSTILDPAATVEGVVDAVGATYLKVKLLEDDDNSASHDLSDARLVYINGTMNEQGATFPESVNQLPELISNYTHIHRTPYKLARTLEAIELRTGDELKNQLFQKALMHGAELEKIFITSKKRVGTGASGDPENKMMGIEEAIMTYAPQNVFNFVTDTDFAGQTWAQGGLAFMDKVCRALFKFGESSKTALQGDGVSLGIQQIVRQESHMTITPGVTEWGTKVKEWQTFSGDLQMLRAPWFNQEDSRSNRMLVLELGNITYCPLKGRDTQRIKIAEDGTDATRGEFLTECTLEIAKPQTMGIVDGIGLNNSL